MLYKLPANFKMHLGAPLMCAGVTVYVPMKKFAKCSKTCAVLGIGGLGHLAVQFGAKFGLNVIKKKCQF
jgi:D-arabinose 1-dehydrogenase-like Zn-dependent alcohol dehydrogenase